MSSITTSRLSRFSWQYGVSRIYSVLCKLVDKSLLLLVASLWASPPDRNIVAQSTSQEDRSASKSLPFPAQHGCILKAKGASLTSPQPLPSMFAHITQALPTFQLDNIQVEGLGHDAGAKRYDESNDGR
jgi:hypothetical protein